MTKKRSRAITLVLAFVALSLWGGLVYVLFLRAPIEARVTQGLTYLVFHKPTINDAVAYTGHLDVDSEGCIYLELDESGVRYLAAFRDGTEVSASGIRTLTGRFYEFGDEVVVGREYDPYFETLDRGSLPKCEATYDVFGVGF
jgi:hypothetical protein